MTDSTEVVTVDAKAAKPVKRGQGRVFLRRGTTLYHCAYYLRGREYRQSTKTADLASAEKFLRHKLKQVGADQIGAKKFLPPKNERITIHEMLEAVRVVLENENRMSPQTRSSLKRADKEFGSFRAIDFTADDVEAYKSRRLKLGKANATINRPLQHLKHCYHLAIDRKLLFAESMPKFELLSEEDNHRDRFLTRAEIDQLYPLLPSSIRDFALFAYLTGMRLREIKSLAWSHVTEDGGKTVVRLQGKNAKTKKQRKIVVAGELVSLLQRRREARTFKVNGTVELSNLIFHKDGKPIGNFRKRWNTVCVAISIGKLVCQKCQSEGPEKECPTCMRPRKYYGPVFHATRYSAVRNLVRAGVPEKVAMAITGHRTRSVFDRYNVTDEEDLEQAMENVQKYHEQEPSKVVSFAQQG